MKASRIIRIIFGLILLGIFAAYMYMHNANWIKSEDIGKLAASAPTETTSEPEAVVETPAPEVTEEPLPTPEPTLDPNSPEARALELGLPAPPDIDINSWEFILANADNSIAEYAPPDITWIDGQGFDSRIVDALNAMAEDTRAQGLSVYLSSGYRDYNTQAANFRRVCEKNGISDGKDAQGFYITMPAGTSEHQTGLCCDITDRYYETKNRSIENTAMFQYMVQHCDDFGFILRFPDGKESITGVMYEPWHFRYVGVEAAHYIMQNDLTFEEFVTLYK